MAPNTDKVADTTVVGEFQAESEEVNMIEEKKKKKFVNMNKLSMEGLLPEQGSWHYERKKKILQKHPEVKSLYGQNPWSFVLMLIFTSVHTYTAINLVNYSWWVIVPLSYTFGTYMAWLCMVLGHEGSHGLVFANKPLNRLHTILAFVPVFFGPFGAFWSIEHMYHHQVVVDKMNRYGDQQNPLIKKIISSTLFISVISFFFALSSLIALARIIIHFPLYLLGMKKTAFPESYALRPYKSFPQVASSLWFVLNMFCVIAFHGGIFYLYGIVPVAYFFLSNGFCNGFHPLGMRQVQEHYIQKRKQPTNSVYSSLSPILLNIGFHVEHHDFPAIPWNRLPKLRDMAPEFYLNLFYYESYTQVMWEFLTKPGIPYTSLLEDSFETEPTESAQKKKK